MNNADRAAALALASCRNVLACFAFGRKPGVANSKKALRAIKKANQQIRRVQALIA